MGDSSDTVDLRIVLVGDRGTGKSSIIESLIREQFSEDLPPKTDDVTIPSEVISEKATTHIVDTSLRVQQEDEIMEEIKSASVICIVYSVDDSSTFERVSSHWLPLIRRARNSDGESNAVPVVLVGNKIDLRNGKTSKNLEQAITPIMHEFKEVETCVECSAKKLQNISEVFYFAQHTVLHPIAPLYDATAHRLKPQAITALSRVFHICDVDKDGHLCDDELNLFQTKCFGQPLHEKEIVGIKEVVRESTVKGVEDDALTLEGFLFLHKLFIERGRSETTWVVLRRFGYTDDLQLRPEYVEPSLYIQPGQTTQLSEEGEAFLVGLFDTFDKGSIGFITNDNIDTLFAVAPGVPWKDDNIPPGTISESSDENGDSTNEDSDNDGMTKEQFLAMWNYLALSDPIKAMKYLAYLGFANGGPDTPLDYSVAAALKVCKSRKSEQISGKTTRRIVTCYVFGQSGSGKTSLLNGLAKSNGVLSYSASDGQRSAIAERTAQGSSVYLMMKEIPVPGADAAVVSSTECQQQCDVALFVFDQNDSSSFAYTKSLLDKLVSGPRPLLVATKADLPEVEQDGASPTEVSAELNIPLLRVSTNDPSAGGGVDELFATVTDFALSSPTGRKQESGSAVANLAVTALVVAGTAAVGYLVYKRFNK